MSKPTYDELVNLLKEVAEVLDDYSDAEYVDGRPVGNRAMSMLQTVNAVILFAEEA